MDKDLSELSKKIQEAQSKAEQKIAKEEWKNNQTPKDEQEIVEYFDALDEMLASTDYISVHEYIGEPDYLPVTEISLLKMESAVNELMEILWENSIGIDWLGSFTFQEKYQKIVEDLFQEEISPVRVPGAMMCFDYATIEYDVAQALKMFQDEFSSDVNRKFPEYVYTPAQDSQQRPYTKETRLAVYEKLWKKYPKIDYFPLKNMESVIDKEAMTARITAEMNWPLNDIYAKKSVWFQLHLADHGYWDVASTNLFDIFLAEE